MCSDAFRRRERGFKLRLIGRWRIVEANLWDRDYLEPG